MRKLIPAATIVAALGVPATSFAGQTTNVTTSSASCEGLNHAASSAGTNFGWLGQDGGASDHGTLTGQMPGATGSNNKNVAC
jgi:hypothetical protein